jgi:molybdopterin synthase catalytic subunit
MTVAVRIQEADFSPAEEYDAMRTRHPGRIGAVVNFVGLVRDQSGGEAVSILHIEHYPGMTEQSIADIVATAEGRWRLDDVVVIHRVGDLAPEAQIVFVQIASAHRADAFAACEFIMDYLKTDAVLWKREATPQESTWLQASKEDHTRRAGWSESSDS